jgi:hypothetical protein
MDKNLLFLILALCCVWLIMSEFYGNKYISRFVDKILDGEEE